MVRAVPLAMKLYLESCQFCYSYLSLVRSYAVSEAAKPLGAIVHKEPGNKVSFWSLRCLLYFLDGTQAPENC